MSSLFLLFKGRNSPPWFWWWSLRPPPFLPFGTMLRNNIKEIPTLFRNFSTLFRKRIFTLFQALISTSNLKKQPKFAENSLRSLNIRFSSAHFAHLISKVMWAGSRSPTPKSMGQNGPLISIGTIPKKVVGIVPNIVPHIVPITLPSANKFVNFYRFSALFRNNT